MSLLLLGSADNSNAIKQIAAVLSLRETVSLANVAQVASLSIQVTSSALVATLSNGDYVRISGSAGWDGVWCVRVDSGTQFTLLNPTDGTTMATEIGTTSAGGVWKKVAVTRYTPGTYNAVAVLSGATIMAWGAAGGGGQTYGAGTGGAYAQTTLTANDTFDITVPSGGTGPTEHPVDTTAVGALGTLTAGSGKGGDADFGDAKGGTASVNFGVNRIANRGGNGGAPPTPEGNPPDSFGVGAGSAGPHGEGFDGEFVFLGNDPSTGIGNGASDLIGPDINGIFGDGTPGARYVGGNGGPVDTNGNTPGGAGGFQSGGTPTVGGDGLLLIAF